MGALRGGEPQRGARARGGERRRPNVFVKSRARTYAETRDWRLWILPRAVCVLCGWRVWVYASLWSGDGYGVGTGDDFRVIIVSTCPRKRATTKTENVAAGITAMFIRHCIYTQTPV